MVPEDRAVDLVWPKPLSHTLLDAVTRREAYRLGPGGEAVIHKVHAVLQRAWPHSDRAGRPRSGRASLPLARPDPLPRGVLRCCLRPRRKGWVCAQLP